MIPPLCKKQRGTKDPLDEGERGEWKSCLKLNIQKMKIMASGPIISRQIDGEEMEKWQTLFSWAPKSLWTVIIAMKLKDACSLEKKLWTNLDSVLKRRDITLSTKVCIVKATVFPVVKYRCQNWTKKKGEHQGTDAFELWCWRRLLRVPWTARRSNQSILKETPVLDVHWKDWC